MPEIVTTALRLEVPKKVQLTVMPSASASKRRLQAMDHSQEVLMQKRLNRSSSIGGNNEHSPALGR